MKILKCIIIEDNVLAPQKLTTYLRRLPYLEIAGVFSNPLEALPILNSGEISILFLDLNLPDQNGIEFANSLLIPPKTIIISPHSIDTYNVGMIDFLIKPYALDKLIKTTNQMLGLMPKYKIDDNNNYIFLKAGKEFLKFFIEKIDYFEVYGSVAKVYYDGTSTILSESITVIQEKLPTQSFIRTHKSFLVSKEKITDISTKNVTLDKVTIPLGISYRVEVEKALGRTK